VPKRLLHLLVMLVRLVRLTTAQLTDVEPGAACCCEHEQQAACHHQPPSHEVHIIAAVWECEEVRRLANQRSKVCNGKHRQCTGSVIFLWLGAALTAPQP
jgi:hypothetical protein